MRTAGGGDRFAVVLEFKFLSGKIANVQRWRFGAGARFSIEKA